MNVAEILQDRARSSPQLTALIDRHRGRSRSLTFSEMEQAVGKAASLFLDSGLRAGDTVLVFHRMSTELYLALIALLRLGMVAMFLDPTAGREHIRKCCALQTPQGLIASSKAHLLRCVSADLRRIRVKFSIGPFVPGAIPFERCKRYGYHGAIEQCSPDSGALLTFTSGSTGEPKAALRTHGFLLAQHNAIEQSLGLVEGEVDLCTQPIFVLANLASGVTSLIPNVDLRRPGAINPAPVVKQIQIHHATRATASPAFFERLIDDGAERAITLPGLNKIFVGGGLVSPRLMTGLKRIAPQAICTAVYGSTEAEPIAWVTDSQISSDDISAMWAGRGVLAGLPGDLIQVRVLKVNPNRELVRNYTSREFEANCLSSGGAGEIVVSGDHVLSGYLGGVGDPMNKFDVGTTRWHRTGDMGFFDERKRLWLLGRRSAQIDDSLGTLFPFAIEVGALQHDFVKRAAVVSIRDRRILAVETRKGELKESQIDLLLETLSDARIDTVHAIHRMPLDKRHNARVDYPALTAILGKVV